MRTELFTLADNAEFGEHGKLFIEGGGIDHVFSTSLPVTLERFAVVLRLVFEERDQGLQAPLRVLFSGPNGEVVTESPNLEIPAMAPGDALALVLNLTALVFPTFANYEVRLFQGDEELESRRLVVEEAPPSEG